MSPGSALTLLGQIGPQLGTGYIVDAFLVVVLGGVGSLPGTILAALVIGTLNPIFQMTLSQRVQTRRLRWAKWWSCW